MSVPAVRHNGGGGRLYHVCATTWPSGGFFSVGSFWRGGFRRGRWLEIAVRGRGSGHLTPPETRPGGTLSLPNVYTDEGKFRWRRRNFRISGNEVFGVVTTAPKPVRRDVCGNVRGRPPAAIPTDPSRLDVPSTYRQWSFTAPASAPKAQHGRLRIGQLNWPGNQQHHRRWHPHFNTGDDAIQIGVTPTFPIMASISPTRVSTYGLWSGLQPTASGRSTR
jgi:hypothetical protein